jgi:hypothetical protein
MKLSALSCALKPQKLQQRSMWSNSTNSATWSCPSIQAIYELVPLHGNTGYVILGHVIQTIGTASLLDKKGNTYGPREYRSSMDSTDSCQWWYHDFSCRTRDMEKLTRYHMIIGLQLSNQSHGEIHTISHDNWVAAVGPGPWRISRDIQDNWNYPKRRSTKYFLKINCSHTTARGANVCFQTIILYAWNFENGYIRTLRRSSFDRRSMFYVRGYSTARIILILSANGNIKLTSASALGLQLTEILPQAPCS